jgi:hypothetical protein
VGEYDACDPVLGSSSPSSPAPSALSPFVLCSVQRNSAVSRASSSTAPAAPLRAFASVVQFFARTCFTRALREHAGMVLRRLSGKTENTAPVLTLITQFGGGKTHTLTALDGKCDSRASRVFSPDQRFSSVSTFVAAKCLCLRTDRKLTCIGRLWP